ncbi:hypothetical protein FACS189456_0220 [Bacteroidia bacterium]|nr:hypothetical protein FACS189456_0220 [Bacteroidia bacterium]
MATIKIGADELILWLRKNGKASKIPNEGLGQIIYENIVNQLNGVLLKEDNPSYWASEEGNINIGKYNLPKTSAQYELATNNLEKLYLELAKL